jgi:hypothetical protein
MLSLAPDLRATACGAQPAPDQRCDLPTDPPHRPVPQGTAAISHVIAGKGEIIAAGKVRFQLGD